MKSQLDIANLAAQFRREIEPNWCQESAHHSCIELAGPNKSIGQCVVSSLLLQERLQERLPEIKTKIVRGSVIDPTGKNLINDHGWIEIEDDDGDKCNLDITLDQSSLSVPVFFDRVIEPKDSRVIFVKDKYLDKKQIEGDLKRRLDFLRSRLLNLEEHYCDKILPVDKYLQIGSGRAGRILAIAESPAANGWRKSGRAFYTPDGKLIPTGKNFLLNLMQIDDELTLDGISFTEIAKCFIGADRKKLDACATKTWGHFLSQMELVSPKIIMLLGQKTTDIFNKLAVTDLEVGKMSEIKLKGDNYLILPIYHPSPANPRRSLNKEIIENNLNVMRELLS